ncbi:MAG: T9SS type A sorting domain-containing protein [Bacteroidetes bacterium]|nr:T9SS type A sorting domain-containing protein [Bacteroidota bacterium]
MKKIAITIILIITAIQVKCQSIGDFRSISDGGWNNSSIWQIFTGSSWEATSQNPALQYTNIYVYHNVILATNIELKANLIIENGSVSINGNTLKIINNLQINNGQLIGGENSTLEINAASNIVELPQITLDNLTINSAQGIIVGGDLTINNELNLQNGILNLGENNLILTANANIKGNFDKNTMISAGNNSIIRKYTNNSNSYFFPIGSTSINNRYAPVEFKFNSGTFNLASFIEVSVSNMKQLDVSLNTTSYIKRFWNINSFGISNYYCDLDFQYSDEDIIGSENEIICMEVKNGDFTKGKYADPSTNKMSISTTEFGQYTGSSTNWVLGCELTKFEATEENAFVSLNWITASESDTKQFEIERSIDAVNFEQIGIVSAAGNSNELNYYSFNDENFSNHSIYYYRLKTIDNNGSISISNTIKINIKKSQSLPTTIFDKSNNQIIVNNDSELNHPCLIQIIGFDGKIVSANEFELTEGANKLVIDANLIENGIYIVSIKDNSQFSSTKLLIY